MAESGSDRTHLEVSYQSLPETETMSEVNPDTDGPITMVDIPPTSEVDTTIKVTTPTSEPGVSDPLISPGPNIAQSPTDTTSNGDVAGSAQSSPKMGMYSVILHFCRFIV